MRPRLDWLISERIPISVLRTRRCSFWVASTIPRRARVPGSNPAERYIPAFLPFFFPSILPLAFFLELSNFVTHTIPYNLKVHIDLPQLPTTGLTYSYEG
jgi:hypothetical protein